MLPSYLWTLPPCRPCTTSSPASSCMPGLFSALVLRGTNAFCIESCKKAARVSLVIIFTRRILALKEAVGLTVSQDFSQSLFLPQLNATLLSFLPHCYIHQELCCHSCFLYFWYLLRLKYQTCSGMELAQIREKSNRVARNTIPHLQTSANLPNLTFLWE